MDEVTALGLGIWAFCAGAVFIGTIVQRLAGQGLGMIATPMVALVAPQFLPSAMLLLGLVVGLGAASVDRSAVAKDELPAGFAGRALGAIIAAWLAVRLVDTGSFAILIALMVYLGVALSLLGVRVNIRPASLLIAGTAAGLMGTLTAVGAPPMALLYQHEDAKRSAAMQNTFFAFGMIVSLASLAVAGLIGWRHLMFAASILPVVLLALAVANPLAKRSAKAKIRPVALTLATLAATVLIYKQVMLS